jgi:hypothetical protein
MRVHIDVWMHVVPRVPPRCSAPHASPPLSYWGLIVVALVVACGRLLRGCIRERILCDDGVHRSAASDSLDRTNATSGRDIGTTVTTSCTRCVVIVGQDHYDTRLRSRQETGERICAVTMVAAAVPLLFRCLRLGHYLSRPSPTSCAALKRAEESWTLASRVKRWR